MSRGAERVSGIRALEYSPELFVEGRLGVRGSRFIDFVYFDDFLRNRTSQFFQVVGPGGIGKTWFLKEAYRRLSGNFEQNTGNNPFPLMLDLGSISLKQLPNQSKELGKQIKEHKGNVVLLVDGAGANTEDRYNKTKMVEYVLLKPQEGKLPFKVVIAQKDKKPFSFSTRYLILPDDSLFHRVLKPFNVEDISDQLTRLNEDPKKAADILEITGGLPILTPILAKEKDPLHHLEKKTLEGMLFLLLPDVKGKQRKELIGQLLPLSVPDAFGNGEINALGLNINMRDETINSMSILSWEKGAYKMDPILRKVLFLLYHLYDKEGAKAAYSRLIDNYGELLQQRELERFHEDFSWLCVNYQQRLDTLNKLGSNTSGLNPKSVLDLLPLTKS